MINLLILNPPLIIIFGVFLIGFVMLAYVPFRYRFRTKKKRLILTPFDLMKYDEKERKLLMLGMILVVFSIITSGWYNSEFGYKTTFTDENGKVEIITIGGQKTY